MGIRIGGSNPSLKLSWSSVVETNAVGNGTSDDTRS